MSSLKHTSMIKLFSIFLSTLLVVTSIPATAFAEEFDQLNDLPQKEKVLPSEDGASAKSDAPGYLDAEGAALNDVDDGGSAPGDIEDDALGFASAYAAPNSVAVSAEQAIAFDGFYNFSSKLNKNKVIDIASGSIDNGANVQLYEANNSPAQRFKIEHVKDGYYRILSVNSNKVLDIAAGSNKSGANVQQYVYNGTDAQLWKITETEDNDGSYYITSKLNDKLALDVASGSTSNGANIQVYTLNNNKAQKFYLTEKAGKTIAAGVYNVATKLDSKKLLDISNGSNDNGGNVQIYSSNSSLAQKFTFSYNTSTGYYTITSATSGKVLDVASGSTSNGANIQQYTSNKTIAQMWTIEKTDDSFVIRSACSGKVLDVANGSSKDGANVQQYQFNDTVAQKWNFTEVKLVNDGYYTVNSALGKVLDVSGGKETNNANIQTYSSNGTLAQKFKVILVSDGYYTFECLNSGRYLTVSGSNVVLYEGNNSSTQLWKPSVAGDGKFYWTNKETGTVLDVANGSSGNGANVQVYTSNKSTAQKWVLASTQLMPDGLFIFKSAKDLSKVFDIADGSADNFARLQVYESNETSAQKFYATRISSTNIYQFTNLRSGKALDVKTETFNAAAGTGEVQQYTPGTGNNAQLWKIEYVGGGYFTFYSQLGNGKSVMDLTGGSTANGTKIGLYPANNTAAQKFKPVATSGPSGVQMPVTLNQMTDIQRTNSYTAAFSWDDVRYYLNPYSWSEGNWEYLQHADVRGYSGMTAGQLNSYIATTANGRAGVLYNQGPAIVTAAKAYNINEVYLLAHAILESAWGTSLLAQRAYYNGTRVYNLFGWGAFDSNPDNGKKYAYDLGWTTVEKSLLGAAKVISAEYIYRPTYEQPTLYMMKWDLMYTKATGARGSHQYATGITWAQSIGWLMGACYSHNGMNPPVNYIVPRYK